MRRVVAALLAGALLVTAPGLDCYRVLAAGLAEVSVPVETVTAGPVVPVGAAGAFGGAARSESGGAGMLRGGLKSRFNGRTALSPSPPARRLAGTSPLVPRGEEGVRSPESPVAGIAEATDRLGAALEGSKTSPGELRSGWDAVFARVLGRSRGSNDAAPPAVTGSAKPMPALTMKSGGRRNTNLLRPSSPARRLAGPSPGLRPEEGWGRKAFVALGAAAAAAPFVTFAQAVAAVPFATLTVFGLPAATVLPLLGTVALLPFLYRSAAAGTARSVSTSSPAYGAPAEESPLGRTVLKGLGAAMALDLGTKLLAAAVLPHLIPGYAVMTHPLAIGHSLSATAAAALMIGGFSYGLTLLTRAAAALRNPAGRRVVRLQRWVNGAVIGATVGQVLEGWLRGGVIDWIYFGGIVTNLADLAVWVAVVHTVASTLFLWLAQRSERNNAPMTYPAFLLFLPVFAAMGVAFGSGLLLGSPAASSLFVYSFFLGVGALESATVMHFMTRQWNSPSGAARGFTLPWSFRVRRQAAAVLVSLFGLPLGAPRLPAAQAEQLLQRYLNRPPKLLILDYDWTLQTNNGPRKGGTIISPETVAALEQLQKAGTIIVIATDRKFDDPPEAPEDERSSITALMMDHLKPEMRRGMLVAVGGGAEIYQYNAKGDKPRAPVFSVPGLSQEEQKDLSDVVRSALEASGIPLPLMTAKFDENRLTLIPVEADAAGRPVTPPDMDRLGRRIRKGLRAKRLDYTVEVRTPGDPTKPKYIVIRKTDKSASVYGIQKLLAEQGNYIQPHEILIIGDETGRDGLDLTMARAAPQAVMISVGKTVDPRASNVFHWPQSGPAATLRILQAIGRHYAERNPEHVFSWSQISLLLRSAREFRDRYGKGAHRGAPYKEPLPAFVGTRAHETMHWLYAQGIPGRDLTKPGQQQDLLEAAHKVYDRLFDQNYDSDRVDADADPYDGLPESLKDLGGAKDKAQRVKRYRNHGWDFVERMIKKYLPFNQDKSIGMEHRIFFHIQGPVRRYLFQAIIDRVSVSHDGFLEVHEYKTGRTLTEAEFKADLQMMLYAIGMRSAYPEYRHLRVRLVRHGPDGDQSWEPTEAEIEQARLRIAASAEQILQNLAIPEVSAPEPAAGGGSDSMPDTISAVPHRDAVEALA